MWVSGEKITAEKNTKVETVIRGLAVTVSERFYGKQKSKLKAKCKSSAYTIYTREGNLTFINQS